MKFHWGHGIAVFYTVFVLVLITVVIKSTAFDNSLVTEEYYQRDINYQQEYDQRMNSSLLEEAPDLVATDFGYRLDFPSSMAASAAGTLHFYRPSTKDHDRTVVVKVDAAGGMNLSTKELVAGRYRAILKWTAGGKGYLKEFEIEV